MIKKKALMQVFSYEFCKFFQDSFLPEHLRPTVLSQLELFLISIFHIFFGKFPGLATEAATRFFLLKKGVLKYFAKLTGKYMYGSRFLIKCFPVNF